MLAEQLGLEPGPELRRLQEAILAHDPAIAPVPVAAPRRGNLPTPRRRSSTARKSSRELVELLREHRLVTLTGPPGVGKSRLALEAARSLEARSPTASGWSSSRRAGGAAGVADLVADAVDARGADPLARVIARLRDADAMLVLDACEHVARRGGAVASAVLSECPGVRVLATSREVLRTSPARCGIHVEPLAGARTQARADERRLAGCAAVRSRAHARRVRDSS